VASVLESRLVRGLERAEEHEQERLGGLLKRCRPRISPERASLGTFLRLPFRIGKAVTQEEVAEAAGISRPWYAMLENDRQVRVSAAVLARIADALTMDPTERATLFRLALPELRAASLTDTSTAILDAFGSYRGLMRRLWAATTEAEALTIVREHAMTQLAPTRMQTCTRIGEGCWEYATTGDGVDADSTKRTDARLRAHLGDAAIDDILFYTLMAQPGEVMTRSDRDRRFPDHPAKHRRALGGVELPDRPAAMAVIRSQRGFVARLFAIHHAPHAFSEVELAQLSALADVASLALSGRV
jgi:transcriptional regulator with XRE-family HTH domain